MISSPASFLSTESAPEIPALPKGVRLVTLENGLTIIVREDHSAPVVSAQAWCKSGSIDEGKWLGGGMSHALEHMLFKGTTTRGAGRIDQEVQDAGGYMNAYTSFDRTVYWINVPNTGATIAIDVLCDIMQHATLPPDELAKEKQVIRREMDMLQDDPGRRSSRRLFETAYTRSPYRFTIIGHPDIFDEVQREDMLAYYREQYTPNNIFYVVAGDVQTDAVISQIQKAFAGAKTKPMPAVALPAEPRQIAPREVIEEAAIELGHFHFAWHIPDVSHPDIPFLDVLAALLGSGRSSRLFQEVREKAGLVHSVDAWTYTPGNAGLFGLSAVVDPDKFDSARAAMQAEVERMKRAPVSMEELGKAVKQFIALTLSALKTMQGQAQDLGANWLAAQDLNFSERYLAAVKRVTAADLQQVAREYLTTENRTLYALLPAGSTVHPAGGAEPTVEHPIHKFELTNGLRLLVKEDHRLPFVQFRAVFQGGVLAESPANNGVTAMTAGMLLKDTPARTAEQLATTIESLGGSLDTYGGNNSFGVHAEVMSGDFVTGLELLADVILNPTFPARELERERRVQLAQIRDLRDHLLQSAIRSMRHALFGGQSYGLDVNGTEESVPNLSVDDLKSFHQRLAVPNNCVLAIFGDVQLIDVKSAVEKWLGPWVRASAPLAELKPAKPLNEVIRVVEARDKKQAVLVAGFRGASLHDPDRFALELIQEACSDLGSRLFLRVRDKLGLAYYVGAQNFLGLVPGFFTFYAGTAPETVDQVETEILKEVDVLRAEGLTAEELKRAKAKIVGQRKIARQDLGGYAMTAALDELYGLGYAHSDTEDAHYEVVTLEQIRMVAQKYLTAESLVIAIIKP